MKRKTPLRRLTALLLCLVLLMQTVVVSSAAETFNPKSETPTPSSAEDFDFSNGTIRGYEGKDKNVVIPAYIDDVKVTRINQDAFAGTDVVNVVIPSTVVAVGYNAFDLCYSLENLYFYGEYPMGFADTLYSYDEWCTYFNIHYKSEFKDGFEDELSNYELKCDIQDGLADPAYITHNWVYTDNGDGTHDATCADKDCDAQKTGLAHEYDTNGDCVCGNHVDVSDPKFFTYSVSDGAAAITGYTGPGGKVTLPSTYTVDGKTYPVTSVADNAFNGNNGGTVAKAVSKITKLTVPASITAVGTAAFANVGYYNDRVWSLEEIVFEGKDVTFGDAALGSNPKLKSVTLPSELKEISKSLFSKDEALEKIVIPASVTSVGEKAFENCTALREVTFAGETAPTMAMVSGSFNGQYPFVGCTGVTIKVPNAAAYTTAWADMLAADPSKAGDITLADQGGVAYIPDFKVYVNGTSASSYTPQYMEYHVKRLDASKKSGTVELKYVGWNNSTKTLEIPESVTTKVLGEDWTFTVIGIGDNAIEEYSSSKYSSSSYSFPNVSFPDTLQYIGKWGCDGLEKVTEMDLSNTQLTEIASEAFRGCGKLKTVKLPATLTKMGVSKTVSAGDADSTTTTITSDENVFACCDALENIYVAEGNPSFKDVDGILYSQDGKKLIRYPNARPATEFTIPEGVEVIASQAFMQSYAGDSKLEKVNFPSTLKEIESLAFRQSNLTEVTLPAGVKFGSCAFDICKKLAKVVIPEGVTELSDYMFWSDEAITEIKLPSTLKKIGDNCFGHCTKLATVDLNKVESIGAYAFYFDPVTEITIPSTANEIGRGAFAVCQELTKVTFEDGCKVIAPFMFTSNYKLADLTLVDSIETIGEYAFNKCLALKEVTMPKSLKSMGDAVFYECWQNLEKVIFPDEVQITYLPASTFESCQKLSYVYLGKNIFSTKPVSLYDTSLELVVETPVMESRFNRNPFDVYGWDLSDTSLFATCEDTGEKDGFGYPIYKVQLTEEGSSSGCCGGGTPVDGYYYVGAGANPTFRYGSYEPVVLTVTGPNAKGETITVSFTKTQLEELAQTAPIGYQYWKSGKTETVVASNKYVPIQALLEKAGIVFGCCDSITAAADDGYGATMTRADGKLHKYYITQNGEKIEVPAALLLSWNTGEGTLEDVVATAYDSGNIRFGYGISQEDYDGHVHGRRIAGKVVSLTVNVGVDESASHTPGDVVKENVKAATATENGSHDDVTYCTECGAELSRTTVTDPATGGAVKTGDAGVAVYAGLCLLALMGGAWTVSKKRSVR